MAYRVTTVSGKVIDEETGKPIEGAIVVILWKGQIWAGVDGHSTCYHVETATTNKSGEYLIPKWKKEGHDMPIFEKGEYLIVYKAGYVSYRSDESGNEYLKPFIGTRSERLEYLLKMSENECFSEKTTSLIPYNKALYDEAKNISVTNEQKLTAERIHYYLNVVKFGWSEADKIKVGK